MFYYYNRKVDNLIRDFTPMESLSGDVKHLRKTIRLFKRWKEIYIEPIVREGSCKVHYYAEHYCLPRQEEKVTSDIKSSFSWLPSDNTAYSTWFKELIEVAPVNKLPELSTDEIVRIADDIESHINTFAEHERWHEVMAYAEAISEVAGQRYRNYSNRLRYVSRNKFTILKRDKRQSYRKMIRFLFKNMDANTSDAESLFTYLSLSKQFSFSFSSSNHHDQFSYRTIFY